MIHFQHPQLLWLLCLVPLLSGIYVWVRITRKRRLALFADASMFQRLTPEVSRWRPIVKSGLVILAFALLIVTLANPQVGSKMVKGERMGSDIAICFDISNSMMAEDIQPNRLERSKRVVANLMNGLAGDRISLIVFAGSSYIQMPLTNDYSAAQLFLDQINCEQISVQGTAIGDAIEKGMETFGYGDPDREWEQNHGRAIIVISDGENFEDDACAAAAKANDEGILVCTIGMGLPDGVPIPEYRGGQAVGYKHDADGNTITTRLNEQMLTDIAHAGSGIYVRGANINAGMHDILKAIEDLEKSSFGESMFSEYESRYYYPLIAALVCLVAEVLLLERRNRKLDWSRLLRRDKSVVILLTFLATCLGATAQSPVPAPTNPTSKIARQLKPSVKELRQGNHDYRKGRYDAAETRYRKALDRDSTFYKSQYNLGNTLYRQQRYDEAISHYQQASQQPGLSKKVQSQTLHNLGNSHLQAGIQDRQNGMQHFQQAVQSYQKSLMLNPKNEDTRYNLSYAKKLLQQAQQNQQQNGGNQNQDQQNKDQQNKDQQNKDQQNKDQQNQDQQNKDKQNKDQQQQKQQQQKQQQQKQQQQKQQQQKQQAEQMLKAVENNEKNTMKDQYKKLEVGKSSRIEKDW